MKYNNIRSKFQNNKSDERIPKYQSPFGQITPLNNSFLETYIKRQALVKAGITDPEEQKMFLEDSSSMALILGGQINSDLGISTNNEPTVNATLGVLNDGDISQEIADAKVGGGAINEPASDDDDGDDLGGEKSKFDYSGLITGATTLLGGQAGALGGGAINAGIKALKDGNRKGGIGAILGGAASTIAGTVDNLALGNLNLGSQSLAVDSAVHGISGILMATGNPYAMMGAGILETTNIISKAGGRTVLGFDVDINSSGYDSNLGHMETKSNRDWGAIIGLGGIFGKDKIQKQLQKRNKLARMALTAAEIADDLAFEQSARMNSIDDVLRNNQIALAGGLDTSLLGA